MSETDFSHLDINATLSLQLFASEIKAVVTGTAGTAMALKIIRPTMYDQS